MTEERAERLLRAAHTASNAIIAVANVCQQMRETSRHLLEGDEETAKCAGSTNALAEHLRIATLDVMRLYKEYAIDTVKRTDGYGGSGADRYNIYMDAHHAFEALEAGEKFVRGQRLN